MTLVTVTLGPNWDKVIKRYINATDKVGLVSAGVVQFMQAETQKEAQHQLDLMVYRAPITASGYQRTGNTRRAVTKGPLERSANSASGSTFVDFEVANREGFPYPIVLNKGRAGTKYYPRPFWTATVALMRVSFQREGKAALAKIKQALSF